MKILAYPKYSVLMSVYFKEKPEYLKCSITSMLEQTVPTNDFVLVCDGPLTPLLDEVICLFQKKYRDIMNVIRLRENKGLGNALQVGLRVCKNELVARMDSDDISRRNRCEKELEIFMNHPQISIVGSNIEEFSVTTDSVNSMRVVPQNNKDIITFSKRRSPFNHPSVMFRKSDVLKAGNYSNVRYMQDYFLWINMLSNGMQGYNIQEPLVWMRVDSNLFRRRSGKLYREIQLNLFKKMKDIGYITYSEYLISVTLRICSASAPNWLRQLIFKKILRK